MIKITNWAYYPNPDKIADRPMIEVLNDKEVRVRLVFWKFFPEHERSVKKDNTELTVENVPIYWPTTKTYKTLLGLGYFTNPHAKLTFELDNDPYPLKDFSKDNGVEIKNNFKGVIKKDDIAEKIVRDTAIKRSEKSIIGYFNVSPGNYPHTLKLCGVSKQFIKEFYDHFRDQEYSKVSADENFGSSGMQFIMQKVKKNKFIICNAELYFFGDGDKYKDKIVRKLNDNVNLDTLIFQQLDERYKFIIKKKK
jgi:hypothetical protein